jgi:hypothetical protein
VSHQALFDKWMKVSRLVGTVEQVRFLGPDVAVTARHRRHHPASEDEASTRAGVDPDAGSHPGGNDGWQLTAFHNTRIRPTGRGVRTFLVWAVRDLLWRLLRLSTDPSPTSPTGTET